MQIFDDEFVGGTIYSAVAPATGEWLSQVGAALDGAGLWRPTRGGGRDPGRSKVPGTATALAAWYDDWITKRDGMWFFSDEKNEVTGRIDVYAFEAGPGLRPVVQHIEFNAQESLFADPTAVERYATTFARLCDAADAFVGWAAHTPVLRQTVQNWMRWRECSGGPPAVVAPGTYEFEYILPDVRWLNYFGPAFVERLGERIDGVGVRRDRTANGGALVWATPTPFVLDREAERSDDYPWKRSFYDAFGAAYMHADVQGGTLGEHVPSVAEHRRCLRCEIT